MKTDAARGVVGGCLYVVATPIGNLEDLTLRAVRVLGQVALIAAEDTRRARQLLAHLELHTPLTSYFAGNEAQRTPQLVERLREGQALALISDAGTPLVSDPGARLVEAVLQAGLTIEVVPGPSAVLAALLLSGFGGTRFRFVGFLPRRGRERQAALAELVTCPDSVVLFEAPTRLATTLGDLSAGCGATRRAAVARELTKRHEEVRRGTLEELTAYFTSHAARGEITLVLGPLSAVPEAVLPEASFAAQIDAQLAQGRTVREVAVSLAGKLGRRRAYQLALQRADAVGGKVQVGADDPQRIR